MADFTIRQIMSLCNRGDVKRTQTAGMKPDRSGGSAKRRKPISQCEFGEGNLSFQTI